jgi:hypothetical protein
MALPNNLDITFAARPSSWPVRRERQRHAALSVNQNILLEIAQMKQTMQEVVSNMGPPGLFCSAFRSQSDSLAERVEATIATHMSCITKRLKDIEVQIEARRWEDHSIASEVQGRIDRLETFVICGNKFAPAVDDVLNKMMNVPTAMEPEKETSPEKHELTSIPCIREVTWHCQVPENPEPYEAGICAKTKLLFDIFEETADVETQTCGTHSADIGVDTCAGGYVWESRDDPMILQTKLGTTRHDAACQAKADVIRAETELAAPEAEHRKKFRDKIESHQRQYPGGTLPWELRCFSDYMSRVRDRLEFAEKVSMCCPCCGKYPWTS